MLEAEGGRMLSEAAPEAEKDEEQAFPLEPPKESALPSAQGDRVWTSGLTAGKELPSVVLSHGWW